MEMPGAGKLLLAAVLAGVLYRVIQPPPTLQQYDTQISGKVFLLCGASSGIGEEITYLLSKYNAKIIIVARSINKLERVKENAVNLHKAKAEDITVFPCDLSSYESIQGMVESVASIYGRIDHVMLNHAATPSGPFSASKLHHNPEFIEKVFRTNVFSNIQITLGVLEELEKHSGHILVTSSAAGELPIFFTGLYGSSKHALNGFFYSLQQELLAKKSNVTVSVAALGIILTKEVSHLMDTSHTVYIPDLLKGDLQECAQLMVDNFITRTRTLSYPKVSLIFGRFLWWLTPFYHSVMLFDKRSYNDALTYSSNQFQLSKDNGFQKGNLGV